MVLVSKAIIACLRSVKQLNLFDTYSTDNRQIRKEILSTRIYLILFIVCSIILFIYSARKEVFYSVKVNNPSIDTYQQLADEYSDTLACPCSQLSVPYSTFVNLTPNFHPVCSSDFVSDRWLTYLYFDDASSYLAYDIRSVGHAQFQLLRAICESSKQAITNSFQATFGSAELIDSRGLIQSSLTVHDQAKTFANNFIESIASEQRRYRALLDTFLAENFLVSGLRTCAIPFIDSKFKLNMRMFVYQKYQIMSSVRTGMFCECDTSYDCGAPLSICSNQTYESDPPDISDMTKITQDCGFWIAGFRTGCLPLNSLLQSTLQCYSDPICLQMTLIMLSNGNASFNAVDARALKRSTPTTLISALADELMVEEWSTHINYSRYFSACRVLSCTYSYTKQFDGFYIVTSFTGLLGGIITILRFLCPLIGDNFYRAQAYLKSKKLNRPAGPLILGPDQSWKARKSQLFIKIRNILLTLNLFERRNSEPSAIREQILTTRLYIACLVLCTTILISITGLDQRMTTIVVSMPTVEQFENLFQTGQIPDSCPCSQIGMPYAKFISLVPTFHQVCSSQYISEDWFDRLTYSPLLATKYYDLDVRLYGLYMFRALGAFCSLANGTTTDALNNFLITNWISTRVLPRQQFHEQVQMVLNDFQTNLKNKFKQTFHLSIENTRGNQFLTSIVSNFFFDGIFDNRNHLMSVQTYMGKKSFVNDTLPTCSCLLSTCSQPLGIFPINDDGQSPTLIATIPGMYGACYPLDALQMSTLECWFNKTCIALIFAHLIPFPVEPQTDPLSISLVIRFTPTTTLGDIINELMIEEWENITDYEAYYHVCKPLACTYNLYRQFDQVYIITVLTAILGGLCVSLRIICPSLIKFYIYCRRTRSVRAPNDSSINHVHAISNNSHPNLFDQARQFFSILNLFESQSPYAHIQRQERLSTRLYIVLLAITITIMFIYLFFAAQPRIRTVYSPTAMVVTQLQTEYSTTLSCPCTQTSMSYSTFLSLQVEKYHPLCSSHVLSKDYLSTLFGQNLIVIPQSTMFKRQFLAGQLSLLASFCALTNQTVNTSLTLFLRQVFVTSQVLTADQFYRQINLTIDRFYLDMSLSFNQSMYYLQAITHGNAIMSSYVSNWQFKPSHLWNASTILTRPVWYGNCSCAISDQCSLPMSVGNITFTGLAIGCLPSSVLLQSTLECFYDQTCLDALHHTLLGNTTISSLPTHVTRSSFFPANTSIRAIFNELFIESWFRLSDYEKYFQTCDVSMCTYTYIQQADILYVSTTLIGLFGGLTIVLRFLCPLIIICLIHFLNKTRKTSPVSMATNVSLVQSTTANTNNPDPSKDITVSGEQQMISGWRNNHRIRILILASTFIMICVTIPIAVSLAIKQMSSDKSDDILSSTISNASITMSTIVPSPTPPTRLCSANATWKKRGITVAGFANGTFSSSLGALSFPMDLHVDGIGNMHILDVSNSRVLYWPVNSAMGRMVIGTGEPGSNDNQIGFAMSFTVTSNKIYVADIGNTRVQSFPFTTSAGSPNGTTILSQSMVSIDSNTPFAPMCITFDQIRSFLYVWHGTSFRLIIVHVSDNHVQIISNSQIMLMDNQILKPIALILYIVIDQKSNSFYLGDGHWGAVIKFNFGSTNGTVVAGGSTNISIANRLARPSGLTFDSSGYLYIADSGYRRVAQLLNGNGDLRTIVGVGFVGISATRLNYPHTIKFDAFHNLYVVDTWNNRVQRFDLLHNGC